jgi:hypothetical protein
MNDHGGEAQPLIEAILTWASVAYGLGFLTVMCNTVPLGIPTLELIEPVQAWVGVPLAIVFYGALRAYRYFYTRRMLLSDDIQIIRKQRDELAELIEHQQFRLAFASLWGWMIRDTVLFMIPFVRYRWIAEVRLWGLRELSEFIAERSIGPTADTKAAEDAGHEDDSAKLKQQAQHRVEFLDQQLRRLTRIYSIADRVLIIYRFCSETLVLIFTLVAAGALYIFVLYPRLPQSWGFGAPTQVVMLLAEEKVPTTAPIMSSLFPPSVEHERQQSQRDPKTRTTVPVTLRLATDHAYYIELPGYGILRLSSEAVGAVLFPKSK